MGQAATSICGAAINGGEQPCMMWIDNEKHQGILVTFKNKPSTKNHLPPNWTSSTHHIPGGMGPLNGGFEVSSYIVHAWLYESLD